MSGKAAGITRIAVMGTAGQCRSVGSAFAPQRNLLPLREQSYAACPAWELLAFSGLWLLWQLGLDGAIVLDGTQCLVSALRVV